MIVVLEALLGEGSVCGSKLVRCCCVSRES